MHNNWNFADLHILTEFLPLTILFILMEVGLCVNVFSQIPIFINELSKNIAICIEENKYFEKFHDRNLNFILRHKKFNVPKSLITVCYFKILVGLDYLWLKIPEDNNRMCIHSPPKYI